MGNTSEALRSLRAAGRRVSVLGADRVEIDAQVFAFPALRAAPTRSDVQRVLDSADRVLVSPVRLTPSVRSLALSDDRVAVSTVDRVIVHREEVDISPAAQRTTAPVARGPRPYARLGIARTILAPAVPGFSQAQIAEYLGITQGAVAKALTSDLFDDVIIRDRGAIAVKQEARGELFDRILAAYPGPGGIATYWWKDSSSIEQATQVGTLLPASLESGDVLADKIAPWRKPAHAVIYSDDPIDLRQHGYATSDADNFTLALVHPGDSTLVGSAKPWLRARAVDPIIAAYDVLRMGTTGDEPEAAELLRSFAVRGVGG